jgi:hypothetical protein
LGSIIFTGIENLNFSLLFASLLLLLIFFPPGGAGGMAAVFLQGYMWNSSLYLQFV